MRPTPVAATLRTAASQVNPSDAHRQQATCLSPVGPSSPIHVVVADVLCCAVGCRLLLLCAAQRSPRSASPLLSIGARSSFIALRYPPLRPTLGIRSFANDATSASRTHPLSPPTPSQSSSASEPSNAHSSNSSYSFARQGSAGEQAQQLSGSALSFGQSFLARLQHASQIELFHYSHIALLAGIPLALLLSPSVLVLPLDLALGLLLPWHSHVGLVNVSDDYVPRPYRALAKAGLTVVAVLATLGLLKINLCGAGITESVKSLWREPPYSASTAVTTRSSGQQVTVLQAK